METWWHQNKDGSLNLEKVREVMMRHVPQGSDAHFGLDAIMARIAALEAEKTEREAQEPVAYVTDEPSPSPEPIWLASAPE